MRVIFNNHLLMELKYKNIPFFQEKIITWYSIYGRKFPWRKKSINNYQRIVSEVLLQRTKAESIEIFFPQFIKKYSSWQKLAKTSKKDLENSLKPIGLYKQRTEKLLKLAKEMEKRNSKFPKQKEKIEALPCMGQYITNAVMLFVHNIPSPLIDVNMARVLERFFGPRKLVDIRYDPYLQKLASLVVKHKKMREINWGILDFAAMVCKNKNPECEKCCLSKKCNFFITRSS
jgi:A/G-specific adenine glycosylase